MKRALLAISLVFLAFSLACPRSFSDNKEKYGFYVPRAKEEIYGTWVNTTDYHGSRSYAQKIEFYDWGYWQEYSKETDEFYKEGTYVLVDRWTDAEGNIWYKDFVRMRNGL
jgi:hypothetical protein